MRPVLLAAVLAATCLPGCGGPKTAPVTGKVLFKGYPLTAGSIVLHPAEGNSWKGEPPSSVLQLDGGFTLKTYPHGDGVPPGAWKVTLAPSLASRIGKPELADAAKTPWTLEVPDGGVKDKFFEAK